MSLVEAAYVDLPEMSLRQPDEVQRRFFQVMATDIPAIAIRQAGHSPDEVHARLAQIMAPLIDYGEPRIDFPFLTDDEHPDSTVHLDAHVAGRTQLNEYVVQGGEVIASLFRLRPSFAREVRQEPHLQSKAYGSLAENGMYTVNDKYVVPVAYRAHLKPQDAFLFTDSRHVHHFRSVVTPRVSTATIYTPRYTLKGYLQRRSLIRNAHA